MSDADLMHWFHGEFAGPVAASAAGTPFRPELIMSIAVREVGYLVQRMRVAGLTTDQILIRCVGDTIERTPPRFPSDRGDLEDEPDGEQMFQIAREALAGIAEFSNSYRSVYDNKPDAFCRGFGIFQYDLQFFLDDPGFFLDRQWGRFDRCLACFLQELYDALARNRWRGRQSLTFEEDVGLAIAYNAGRYRPERGRRQGHRNSSSGRYYGEDFADLLTVADGLDLTW
jgi:hypothetical protein